MRSLRVDWKLGENAKLFLFVPWAQRFLHVVEQEKERRFFFGERNTRETWAGAEKIHIETTLAKGAGTALGSFQHPAQNCFHICFKAPEAPRAAKSSSSTFPPALLPHSCPHTNIPCPVSAPDPALGVQGNAPCPWFSSVTSKLSIIGAKFAFLFVSLTFIQSRALPSMCLWLPVVLLSTTFGYSKLCNFVNFGVLFSFL